MSLTLEEKIELVADRYNPEEICDALELTSLRILEEFSEDLDTYWYKFEDVEIELEENMDGY
jgi:hypothetical protein